jgi:hypothetical protein
LLQSAALANFQLLVECDIFEVLMFIKDRQAPLDSIVFGCIWHERGWTWTPSTGKVVEDDFCEERSESAVAAIGRATRPGDRSDNRKTHAANLVVVICLSPFDEQKIATF